MAQQTIGVTRLAQRTSAAVINANFTELYNGAGGGSSNAITANGQTLTIDPFGSIELDGDEGHAHDRGIVWNWGQHFLGGDGINSSIRQEEGGLWLTPYNINDGIARRWRFDGETGLLQLPDGSLMGQLEGDGTTGVAAIIDSDYLIETSRVNNNSQENHTWLFGKDGNLSLSLPGVIKGGVVNTVSALYTQLQWTTPAGLESSDPNGTTEPINWLYVDQNGINLSLIHISEPTRPY